MEIKINNNDIEKFRNKFKKAKPYSYVVIDNFFKKDLLDKVALSFPPLKDDKWFRFRDKIGDFDNIFESGMNAISKPDIMPTV
jgi:hypothetical protein